jgi:exopolysaccharide biosynthesis polyprenyl glycosylphosphotransferase
MVQQTHVFGSARRAIRPRSRHALAGWPTVAWRCGQAVADAGLVWLAFWLAYQVRYRLEWGGAVRPADYEPFSTFQSKTVLFVVLTVVLLFLRGLYRLPRTIGFLDEAQVLVGGVTTAMAGVILTAFLARFVPSRLVFIYAWGIAIAFLLARRVFTRGVRRMLWARGVGVDRVLIVGAGETGRRLMQAMIGLPGLGYRVVGFVDDATTADALAVATENGLTRTQRLGATDDFGDVVARLAVDEVIIALPGDAHDRALEIIDHCRKRAVSFKLVPDLLQLSVDRVDFGEVAGMPLIGLKDASIRGANRIVKRTIDVATAVVVLATMALPMAVIAALIRRDSPGPVLFRQRRIGRNGMPFTCLKFRCMVENADEQRAELIRSYQGSDPRLFKLPDDPRLTPVGKRLRRWSLDELPQFVNVVRGEMSVVGPRPPLPEEVAAYEDWHHQRLLVTPGLTGLWQINGRSNLTFDEMVRLDLYYAEHWSPWLDFKIVVRTAPAILTRRGAY